MLQTQEINLQCAQSQPCMFVLFFVFFQKSNTQIGRLELFSNENSKKSYSRNIKNKDPYRSRITYIILINLLPPPYQLPTTHLSVYVDVLTGRGRKIKERFKLLKSY